ncbi:MAG TPA: gamma-glutamyltransferase, partial [Thermodesulfobacteriota bacterium]|nr:gamma-glutamyltransferase [Thermodesulfobacteriota bacterium]
EKGPDYFYRGDFAEALAREMRAGADAWITREDLSDYRALPKPAAAGTFRHFRIEAPPPPSGAVQFFELMNILEGFDTRKINGTAAGIHGLAEAQRRVMADRASYMGDPDFVSVPLQGLLSKRYAEEFRRGIRADRAAARVSPGKPRNFETTTQLCVVDGQGNIVSLTQTINSFFGSGVVVPGTGVLLNNEMHEFSLTPGAPNSFAPGKRPLSSMSPAIVFRENQPYVVFGSAGAARIFSAMAQTLLNIESGMNVQQAVNAPRAHWDIDLFVEARIPSGVRSQLAGMGYSLVVKNSYDFYFGGVQAIMIDGGRLYGAADPRRDGAAIGY